MRAIFDVDASFQPNLQNSLERMHPEDRNRIDAEVRRAIATREAYDIEYRIVRPDGSIRFIHAWGRVLGDPGEPPERMVGAVHDITDRKLAEEALRKGQTKHLLLSLYRILGGGASAVLYRAGSEASRGTFAFLREGWNPRDEKAFIEAMREHFRSAGLCEDLEMDIDRAAKRATIRVKGNFEATLVEGRATSPACHLFRGLLAGVTGGLLGETDLVGDEVECQAAGKEACTFQVHPMFG